MATKAELKVIEDVVRKVFREEMSAIAHQGRVLYDINEAAELLRVSVSTLHREHREGHIAFKKSGRRTLIHRDELESYARHLPSE